MFTRSTVFSAFLFFYKGNKTHWLLKAPDLFVFVRKVCFLIIIHHTNAEITHLYTP